MVAYQTAVKFSKVLSTDFQLSTHWAEANIVAWTKPKKNTQYINTHTHILESVEGRAVVCFGCSTQTTTFLHS